MSIHDLSTMCHLKHPHPSLPHPVLQFHNIHHAARTDATVLFHYCYDQSALTQSTQIRTDGTPCPNATKTHLLSNGKLQAEQGQTLQKQHEEIWNQEAS